MNLAGTWNLEVSTPFGKYPATLVFEPGGDGSLTGHIDSRLGTAPLTNLSAEGDGFDALVMMDFKGKNYEAAIGGLADGDRIEGTIKVKLPIAPPSNSTAPAPAAKQGEKEKRRRGRMKSSVPLILS